MKLIGIEEKKNISLRILIEINKICKNNGIKYFLAYGTLLGAIRHRGFIPWDDDIDLVMFPSDYLKFIDIFNSSQSNSELACVSYEKGDFALPYAKVVNKKTCVVAVNRSDTTELSIGVDIFPYSVISKDRKESLKVVKRGFYLSKLLRYRLYNSFCEVCDKKFSLRKFLFYVFAKSHSKKRLFKKTIDFKERYYGRDCGFCTYLFDSEKDRLFNYDWFGEVINVEFEGYQFPAPKGYDSYLREYYGNYMELPPENQRIPHIAETAFWKD